MVVREYYKTRNDGVRLYLSNSSRNVYIRKVGTEEIYTEAIDVEDAPFTYEETNIPIETDSDLSDL